MPEKIVNKNACFYCGDPLDSEGWVVTQPTFGPYKGQQLKVCSVKCSYALKGVL